ncbi:MAG: prolyl-tRNA synthetase associated domain-containing protein [Fimbriimonadaceae bacterium]|nr:prolyl-tRNA synthetase associated domain-containing protein [Alphaproteobacteria bacterium]
MKKMRESLVLRFHELGIEAPTVPYPSHRTVEEGKALRGNMPGTFTKNLLLKDKKGRLFLMVAHEDQSIDLKVLHKQIGAKGRLGFASANLMRSALGIEPGALTPLALLNDKKRIVTVVIDAGLVNVDQLNFHPLINTESTGLKPTDLLSFIKSCGHEAIIADLNNSESEAVVL